MSVVGNMVRYMLKIFPHLLQVFNLSYFQIFAIFFQILIIHETERVRLMAISIGGMPSAEKVGHSSMNDK